MMIELTVAEIRSRYMACVHLPGTPGPAIYDHDGLRSIARDTLRAIALGMAEDPARCAQAALGLPELVDRGVKG